MNALPRPILRLLRTALVLACTVAGATGDLAAQEKITVFAAASLKTALDEIARQWQAETGHRVIASYAASSALARQIEAGAPADVFLSANTDWMDELVAQDLVEADSVLHLFGNRLVLIGGAGTAPRDITPDLPLDTMLGDGRLAMGLVDAVPVGIYGKAALVGLGLWPGVAARVAQTDNTRAALALVATGAAPYGIVYATDAHASDAVSVVGVFPEGSHPPISYALAPVRDGDVEQARAFLDYLATPPARAVLTAEGFVWLGADR